MDHDYFYTERMAVGYDGKPLLSEIEIHLERGQILTLIGPNGGGKSTILKSITRQLKLLGGKVWLGGADLWRMSGKELAQRMAVVLTERMKPELMTCEDVVATGRYPYTGALGILSQRDREKTEEALALVHALELRDRSFQNISDGQRQRILLARAICQEPEIIVLDEPTSYLDIRHKLELLSILKQMVRERNVAVVMSLHELDLAQKVSDTVLCVQSGRIGRVGTPEEVFTSDYIEELYGVTGGSYNATFGCMELAAPAGEPEVFVIAGGGSGVPVYRRLARQQVPFATGVLHRNDLDYEVARALATRVIAEEPFEPVSDARVREALEVMDKCKEIICTIEQFGTMNEGNRVLLQRAEGLGA